MKDLLEGIPFQNENKYMKMAEVGDGKILLSSDLNAALIKVKIDHETINETALKFIRRKIEGDTYYYLVNHTSGNFDETVMFIAKPLKLMAL